MNSLTKQKWEAIVIGAGPAGAFTAFQLAKAGKKVLLLDKAHFPRPKVCGCCINQTALRVLQRARLEGIFALGGAVALSSLQLFDGTASATIKLLGSQSLSREYFDTALIAAAVAEGAQFLPGATAKLSHSGEEFIGVQLCLKSQLPEELDSELLVESKVTIVADGLNGHALDQMPGFSATVAADARFGCGSSFASAKADSCANGFANGFYQLGRIYMACQEGGYVGIVLLESGLDIACALDRAYVRQQESLPAAVANILRQCNLPLPVPFDVFSVNHWHGTDLLTRRRSKISGQRIFVVGDACGYPEPLTGEGIAWALEAAEAVAPLAISAIEQWHDSLAMKWQQAHAQLVSRRQFKSRAIAYSLRSSLSRRALIYIVSLFPALAQGIASSLNRPSKQRIGFE